MSEFVGRCSCCGKELPGIRPNRFARNPNRRCILCYMSAVKHFYRHSQGYIVHREPGKNGKQTLEHREVMEKTIGKALKKGEVVHHINGIRTDNRPENLRLYKNAGLHVAEEHPNPIFSRKGKK